MKFISTITFNLGQILASTVIYFAAGTSLLGILYLIQKIS